MNIPNKIDSIVSYRQKKLPQVIKLQQQLKQINKVVRKFDEICQEASSDDAKKFGGLFQQYPEIIEKLRFVNTKSFNDCYVQTQLILGQLNNRFSRKEIHISFVGRAGQGKSLVMQNISGLSGTVIPSSDGADCTGAKSIITNSTGYEKSSTR